jgi:hypothetical protein
MPKADRLSSGAVAFLHQPHRSFRATVRILLACFTVGLVGPWPVPAPRPSPLVGVNLHPLQNVYAIYPPARVLDRAAELGVSVVRVDVPWDWLEWTAPGVEGWNDEENRRLDAFVDAARQQNLQVLAVVQDTPCWASSDPEKVCSPTEMRYNWREPPTNPGDFADFLTRLVGRFRGRIQYWEIWNEPNLPHFWPRPDPIAYTRLLQAAYPAIKAADPVATVLAGALSPIDWGDDGYPALAFVDAMYAAGAKGSFDALSFHPYSSVSPLVPRPWVAPIHDFFRSVPALHERMLAAGDPRPIWITEVGWATSPADGTCAGSPGLAGEADQARFLADELRTARAWEFVDGFIAYELFDRGMRASCNPEDHFGLFHHDLTPKLAVNALRS